MRNKHRHLGTTLSEMTVVIGIAALMLGLAVPTTNMLLNSFETESGAKSIISSALASARGIAAKEQHYAGIRFQKQYNSDDPDPLKSSQYIIFIVQDPNLSAFGFKAVEGIQPIKLPDSIGVMDLYTGDMPVNLDTQINEPNEVNDTTTFSIVFSPSGKLVIHEVRAWNRDAKASNASNDDIFNTYTNVAVKQISMFYQDDNPSDGFGQEPSRNSFVIYDTKVLKQIDKNLRWTNYLGKLKRIYINPYTGTIINEK
jgi:hypothetical protein